MTHRVGTKGQVVIPKAIRDELGIRTGDEVSFVADGDEVRILRAGQAPRAQVERIEALRGAWTEPGSGTEALLAERRAEREREERKARGRGDGRL
jgi:AbrB family looped-hinge helix DNA binding protein